MKFWCLNQKYFDSGKVKVNVYSVESETKPENGMRENNLCDEYHDYFDNYSEAKAFADEAENA